MTESEAKKFILKGNVSPYSSSSFKFPWITYLILTPNSLMTWIKLALEFKISISSSIRVLLPEKTLRSLKTLSSELEFLSSII
jgi:hypothetical protein